MNGVLREASSSSNSLLAFALRKRVVCYVNIRVGRDIINKRVGRDLIVIKVVRCEWFEKEIHSLWKDESWEVYFRYNVRSKKKLLSFEGGNKGSITLNEGYKSLSIGNNQYVFNNGLIFFFGWNKYPNRG